MSIHLNFMKTNKLFDWFNGMFMSLTACTATTDNVTTQPTDSPIVLPNGINTKNRKNKTTEPTDGTGDTMNRYRDVQRTL